MSKFILSIGDSDKYSVDFNGSYEEFLESDRLKEIKNKIYDYLKEKFPAGGYSSVDKFEIYPSSDSSEYKELNEATWDKLLESAKTQEEVLRQTQELNNNAPYDKE